MLSLTEISDDKEERIDMQLNVDGSHTKKTMKRTIVLTMVLSFAIPIVIMALAFYNSYIYPGGANTILVYDMRAQFVSIYASLRYLWGTDNSIFYSFFGALGNNALPNYAAYVLDPMSWITVLFSLEQLPNVLYFITLIKIGLCGLSFCAYVFYGREEKDRPVITLILSCCYALMSYNIIYGEVLIWLNVVILTPIVLLGMEKLIKGRSGTIYLISIFFSLCFCFQLAYMTGIFAILYIIYRMSETKFNYILTIKRFMGSSFVALGLYMPIFAPTIMQILGGRLGGKDATETPLFYYSVLRVLKQFGPCKFDIIESGGLPNVFCGTITIVLVVIYFIKGANRSNSKMVAGAILLLYIISFCVGPINRAWHGFMEPYSYPCRYSYTLCIFMLILALQASDSLCVEMDKAPRAIAYFVGGFIATVVMVELYFNAAYIVASLNTNERYELSARYDRNVSQIKDIIEHISDDEFYRLGRVNSKYAQNDGMLWGYNGIAYFSSNYSKKFMDFMGLMGYSQNEHVLEDVGATPVMESILGVRYGISKNDVYRDSFAYDPIYEDSPFCLTQNRHTLPVGFVLGSSESFARGDIRYTDVEDDGNPFAYHDLLLSDIYGMECNIYEKIQYSIEEMPSDDGRHIGIDFVAQDERPIWLYCKDVETNQESSDDEKSNEVINSLLTVNGVELASTRTDFSHVCTFVGRFKSGEKVHIDIKDDRDFGDPWIVYYDETVCNQILDTISDKGGIEVEKHSKGRILGKVNVLNDNMFIMFTLPYMQGYKIMIDGHKVGYEPYRNVLLLVNVPKGEHMIELSFCPPGFVIGLFIASITAFLLLVYAAFISKKNAE